MNETEAPRATLGNLMHDGARLMRRRFMQLADRSALSLNPSEASALVRIARHEGSSQTALALQLDIEPIALVRLLDGLQARGLIERRPSATDRRVRTLWLGSQAPPMLRQVLAIRATVREEALTGIAQPQRDALLDSLRTLRVNLRDATTRPDVT